MTRTPKQVHDAIMANIQQAMIFEAKARGAMVCKENGSAFQAYKDCAAMIKSEFAELLNPPIIRHLSNGEAVEMVRPFDGDRPAL